jgi:hypothetical protein
MLMISNTQAPVASRNAKRIPSSEGLMNKWCRISMANSFHKMSKQAPWQPYPTAMRIPAQSKHDEKPGIEIKGRCIRFLLAIARAPFLRFLL